MSLTWIQKESLSLDTKLVISYPPGPDPEDTPLSKQLRKIDVNDYFSRQFRDAHTVFKALGRSASDLLWRHWMESANLNLYPPAEICMRKLIESWSFDMPEVSLNYSSSNVTPQFAKLVRILQSYESRGQDFRGIIVGTLQVIIIIFYLHDSYLCSLN